MKKFLVLFLALIAFVSADRAQNRFEGHNIILDVPTTQRSTACAIRYAPPSTAVTIVDLDRGTPMRVTGCEGRSAVVQGAGGSATLRANPSDNKWCFQGEDKMYKVMFSGDQFSGPIAYNWIAEPPAEQAGFYNVRDFGATGDGRTDDTIAIKSAFAYIASRNGGTLTFPEGDYRVTSSIAMPSGIVIQGTSAMPTNAPVSSMPRKNPTRIKLSGVQRAIFRIGECSTQITLRDIELYSESTDRTFGVEMVGAYDSSGGIVFERVIFNNFYRGIYAYGLPQTELQWQVDYIKVKNALFVGNTDAGIYVNARNTDIKVEGSLFVNAARRANQNGDSMRFERANGVLIQDTFGGGFPGAPGGTFIDVLDNSLLTIIGSSSESMTNSMVINSERHPQAGNYSGPITMVNCAFGDPIIFHARRSLVSTGNSFNGNTFKAGPDVRIYSTGDRFCSDGFIWACRGMQKTLFDKATVIFMTGQPTDGQVPGHPTFFGTDVEFGAPAQMQALPQTALPPNRPNGSLVYCNNCRRATTPCQGGGSGAPAMVVAGQWSCL